MPVLPWKDNVGSILGPETSSLLTLKRTFQQGREAHCLHILSNTSWVPELDNSHLRLHRCALIGSRVCADTGRKRSTGEPVRPPTDAPFLPILFCRRILYEKLKIDRVSRFTSEEHVGRHMSICYSDASTHLGSSVELQSQQIDKES